VQHDNATEQAEKCGACSSENNLRKPLLPLRSHAASDGGWELQYVFHIDWAAEGWMCVCVMMTWGRSPIIMGRKTQKRRSRARETLKLRAAALLFWGVFFAFFFGWWFLFYLTFH